MLWKAVKVELFKMLHRGRSYIGFLAVIIILLLIEIGLMLDGQALLDTFINNLRDSFYLQGNLLNGYLVTYFALNTLWIHIPILVVIVTGDLVSGESASGTYRLYLTRPVSRRTVISAKFITAIIYTTILVGLLALFSIGLGILVFGKGDLIVLIKGINIIPSDVLPFRFLLAFLFGLIGMCMVSSLSFFFSCLSENSITPIILSMAIIIVFTILSNFDIGIFDHIKPFLFTTYMSDWRKLFDFKIAYNEVFRSTFILLIHIFVLYILSIWVFNKKDITT